MRVDKFASRAVILNLIMPPAYTAPRIEWKTVHKLRAPYGVAATGKEGRGASRYLMPLRIRSR